ncbi:hypothetical protein NI389_17635 (plasmid) [Pseudoalteromonas xiamenensis]|uniref:hypothetical protein n=1 Tax=Pseudoalteromonas xiamenensis TaxID=882626 RepID=UPI0027E589BD|nr:hypothetical protein [Pseudoalteromonas xiamenensis]WMN61637.1 hypothetical protein NI389_17635 [Pseudoalteromonas xiamenensis]
MDFMNNPDSYNGTFETYGTVTSDYKAIALVDLSDCLKIGNGVRKFWTYGGRDKKLSLTLTSEKYRYELLLTWSPEKKRAVFTGEHKIVLDSNETIYVTAELKYGGKCLHDFMLKNAQ